MFNHANQSARSLRRTQEEVQEFENNVDEKEADYNSRLIEIFGYPYPEDKDPISGQTYGLNYDGPDLYHWAYVDVGELIGVKLPDGETIDLQFQNMTSDFAGGLVKTAVTVSFNRVPGFGLVKPKEFTLDRRAPGEIQLARGEMIQSWRSLNAALEEYDQASRISRPGALSPGALGLAFQQFAIKGANVATQGTLNAVIIGL